MAILERQTSAQIGEGLTWASCVAVISGSWIQSLLSLLAWERGYCIIAVHEILSVMTSSSESRHLMWVVSLAYTCDITFWCTNFQQGHLFWGTDFLQGYKFPGGYIFGWCKFHRTNFQQTYVFWGYKFPDGYVQPSLDFIVYILLQRQSGPTQLQTCKELHVTSWC